jgi:hypothetical protein
MIDSLEPCDAAIQDSLLRHADCLEPGGACRWAFDAAGDGSLPARAWVEGQWLRFRIALDGGGPEIMDANRLQQMLQANADLEGGVKFGLASGPGQGLLAAEVLLSDDPADLDGRVRRVCAGLRQGAALYYSNFSLAAPSSHSPPAPGDIDLPGLCSAAGWRPVERPGGQAAVALDVPGVFLQALIAPRKQGGLAVQVALENAEGVPSVCRRALHVLLLSACRTVRMARALAGNRDEEADYRWEVVLDDAPGASALGHALAALSVACRLSAREVTAFYDETIARNYLAVRGWSSSIANGDC